MYEAEDRICLNSKIKIPVKAIALRHIAKCRFD